MNKLFTLLAALVILFLAGCSSNANKKNGNALELADEMVLSTKVNCMADYDLVYLENGKLVFYHVYTKKSEIFSKENDSVVNAVYLDDSTLFYTVSVNENLVLKRLNLKDEDPEPLKEIDWNLKLKDCENFIEGSLGDLSMNREQTMIGMGSDMAFMDMMYSKQHVYDIYQKEIQVNTLFTVDPKTGEITGTDEVSAFSPYNYYNIKGADFDFNREGELFYVKDGARVCLTNQFNYRDIFHLNPNASVRFVEVYPITMNPQGTKLLFTAMMPWGNYDYSTYCVASIDGQMQVPLYSELTKVKPRWLKNGSLVYVTQPRNDAGEIIKDAEGKSVYQVMIMDSRGKINAIGNARDFVVKPILRD